jgi:hypothetical protein
MDIPYRQLMVKDALKVYADWLLEQQIEKPVKFFKCIEKGENSLEWYMIFYPMRTLLLTGKLFGEQKYIDPVIEYIDSYISEQLPNGGFTSNYRQQPTRQLSKKEFHELLRCGKINIADVGSNVVGIMQASEFVNQKRKEKYLNAVKRWLDDWVPIWALKDGGYGNGIWIGHKLNAPYTCAISTIAMAFAAFTQVSGDREYIENAERCIEFQCSKWLNDGRPIFMNCYPEPFEQVLEDYSHSFYLLEGMCWTHYVSKNKRIRDMIEKRMREWLFNDKGLLSQWASSWFSFQTPYMPPLSGEMISSRRGLRLGWELAKSNGIPHTFLYYLNHIEDNPCLRKKVELGLKYLSNPLKARMSGVASEPEESYGMFAVQATGFAGLSLAEASKMDSVFNLKV